MLQIAFLFRVAKITYANALIGVQDLTDDDVNDFADALLEIDDDSEVDEESFDDDSDYEDDMAQFVFSG